MEKRDTLEPMGLSLEESLRVLPLADLPPGFAGRVMAQLAAQPQAAMPRFQLQFLDVALAMGLSSFVTLLLVMVSWYLEQTGVGWLPNLLLRAEQAAQSPTAVLLWIIVAAIIAAEVVLGAFVCVQLWQDRPYAVG